MAHHYHTLLGQMLQMFPRFRIASQKKLPKHFLKGIVDS